MKRPRGVEGTLFEVGLSLWEAKAFSNLEDFAQSSIVHLDRCSDSHPLQLWDVNIEMRNNDSSRLYRKKTSQGFTYGLELVIEEISTADLLISQVKLAIQI